MRQAFDLACSLQGLQYQVVYSGNFAALLALAIRGEAPTLASYLSAAHAVTAGQVMAVSIAGAPFEQRSVQLLTLQGRGQGEAVRAFRDHLAEAIDTARRPSSR